MLKIGHKSALLFSASICSVAGAASAWAQDASSTIPAGTNASPSASTPAPQEETAAPQNDADIVVTAQRREQKLKDVPVSVSVVSGESIEKQGIRDLQDLAGRIPTMKFGTSTQSDVLTIRGIGSGVSAGFEQAVGTFVDGAYRGRSRSTRAALFDIDRVEVLKGPQTTFFGNNAIAGALNITTRKPGQELSYNGSVLYSPSDGEYSVEAGLTLPLTPSLSIRGAFKASGMDGYIYNIGIGDSSPHLRDWIGRVSLRWEPSSNFRSDLRFDRVRNRDQGTYTPDIIDCPAPPPFAAASGGCAIYLASHGGVIDNKLNFRTDDVASFFNLDMSEGNWTNRLSLGDFTLSANTTYYHHQTNQLFQAVALNVPGVGNSTSRTPFQPYENYSIFSQELRVESPTGGFFEYMVGAYYAAGDLKLDSYSGFNASAVGALGAPATNATTPIVGIRRFHQKDYTRSVFASASFNFTEALRLNLGARYTSVRKTASRQTELGIGGAIPDRNYTPIPAANQAPLAAALNYSNAPFSQPTTTYAKFMPTANVQFKISPQVTTYASYTKGFLAGGYTDGQVPDQFSSEFVDAYEIGLKGSVFNNSVTFAVDAFISKYSDLQEAITFISPLPPFGSVTDVQNAAKAQSRGIEVNAQWRVSSNFSLRTDLAFIDAKYTSYTGAACTVTQILTRGSTCTQDLSGRPRVLSPKFTGTLGADLFVPIGADYSVGISPAVYHSSSYYANAAIDPRLMQKAYEKVDLRIDFGPTDRKWSFAVVGKNLTNSKTTNFAYPMASSPGTRQILLDRARSVAFSFTFKR